MPPHQITRADIMPMEAYLKIRREKRRDITQLKRHRRLSVGPYATFYFESWQTMWFQIHEMLAIERGGEAQIPDELSAYNPLVPNGHELVATVMFEIDDPVRRKVVLGQLGGVEDRMALLIGDRRVPGRAEADVDRTSAAGKASSVQFVHFDLDPAGVAAFRAPDARVMVGIEHPNYGHMALLSDEVRRALAEDLD